MNEHVKILIVDDEPRNLDALEVMLQPTRVYARARAVPPTKRCWRCFVTSSPR